MKISTKLFIIVLSLTSFAFAAEQQATATFAGGCFWCMQADFDKLPGITKTIVGYTGGHTTNPSYQQVTRQDTGHSEGIKVFYDPQKISYQTLLNFYWKNIDPVDTSGQFCDKGESYKAVIFYANKQQKRLADASKKKVSQKLKNVTVSIKPATIFYPAENYHQDYYKKNPIRYKFYRWSCERDLRLKQLFNKN